MANLHPAVQRAIRDAAPGDERRADVMMATHGTLNDEQRRTVASLGASVRTIAGNIVTLDLPLSALKPLGELEFVRYVELAQPLWLEKK